MNRALVTPAGPVATPAPHAADLQPLPAWATPRRAPTNDAEAAFLAGAALNSLDNLARAAPPWAGAWRQRQALKSAAAAVRLAGGREDEPALRDAFYLRAPGDALGPAGNLFLAWKRLASRSPVLDEERLRSTTELLGIPWRVELAACLDRVEALAHNGMPGPFAAAAIAADVCTAQPEAELLAWWLADFVLAQSLRWPVPVPLLIGQAFEPAFRAPGSRRRVRPGDDGFARAVCLALAAAAAEALSEAARIARRVARLCAVAPKLRAKGAGEAIALLLEEDAVPGTLQTKTLSRWASRRLFERLAELEAVRELSGRPTFRLYGL